jgi:hypothetical protein
MWKVMQADVVLLPSKRPIRLLQALESNGCKGRKGLDFLVQ